MHNGSLLRWAVAEKTFPGLAHSGDQSLVKVAPDDVHVMAVIDGLGHGKDASVAAIAAVEAMEQCDSTRVDVLMERSHQALRRTRGAVASIAVFEPPRAATNGEHWRMTWVGVGNVKGILLRYQDDGSSGREWLLARGGIVGYNMPTLRPVQHPVFPGDLLVFATDGLRSSFVEAVKIPGLNDPDDMMQNVADRILEQAGRGTDDALVLVAQFLGNAASG